MSTMTQRKGILARLLPPAVAIVALGTSFGYSAHEYMAGDCCHAGSPCCFPGSPCCHGHKGAAAGPIAMK